MWPRLTNKAFSPAKLPLNFTAFPKEMAVRPSQIRASAAESALTVPDAVVFRRKYKSLRMPVVIISGESDRVVQIEEQSARLHRELPQSKFMRVPGVGHMVHQTAAHWVLSAINEHQTASVK
jgi:pimeloyl-ACP methyl ester carboxylesterase